MALVWCDGFDGYGDSNGGAPSPSGVFADKYASEHDTNRGDMHTTPSRWGSDWIYEWSIGAAYDGYITAAPTTTGNTLIAGIALRIESKSNWTGDQTWPILAFRTSTGNVCVKLVHTNGTFTVFGPDDAYLGACRVNIERFSYHYIEMKVYSHATEGTVDVRFNGCPVFSTANIDTMNGAKAERVGIGDASQIESTSDDCKIDDFYICDGSGNTNNDFLGPVRIETLWPNGDDTANWTTTANSANHYENVNLEARAEATDYVEESGSGVLDLFTLDNTGISWDTIYGVSSWTAAAYDTSSADLQQVISSNGTTENSSNITLTTSYVFDSPHIVEDDPDTGNSWTSTTINALKSGFRTPQESLMAGSRVAQHYVQVVGLPDTGGELRVRRLYAEVLSTKATGNGTTHNETVNQSLNITDTGHGIIDSQEATSTLNLSHQINLARQLQVAHTITFTQTGGRTQTGSSSSTLTLSQAMIYFNYVADRTPVEQTLNLTHEAYTLQSIVVEQNLDLSDSAEANAPIKPGIVQFMGIYQHVSTPYHMWVEHELGLWDRVRVPVELSLNHTLSLTDVSSITNIDQTLSLTDQADYSFGIWASNDLTLTHTLGREGVWIRSASHDLSLENYLTWYDDTPCNRKRYTPFQGDNSQGMRGTLHTPQGQTTDRLSLYQPAIGVRSSEVILRAPEMDNRDRNAYSRVQGETRGGKLRVYADPTWPKIRTLAVTIIGLTESQVDDFHTFLTNTLGQTIGLTDWEGRLWEGIITNPDEVATQDGKGRWTISFEFEGEMLENELPGDEDGNGMAMNLTHSATAVIV